MPILDEECRGPAPEEKVKDNEFELTDKIRTMYRRYTDDVQTNLNWEKNSNRALFTIKKVYGICKRQLCNLWCFRKCRKPLVFPSTGWKNGFGKAAGREQ